MIKLIQKINKIPKSYFSLSDIKKVADIKDASLKVAISRLLKDKQLIQLSKGIYTLDLGRVEWENFAVAVYGPSYISFESALNYYGILSQQAVNFTLATVRRSKTMATGNNIIIYHHINPGLFWGYVKKDNYLIAEPEKAWLDLAYLSLNGYAKFDYEEMNIKELNRNKIKKYFKRIDNKRLNNLVRQTGMKL